MNKKLITEISTETITFVLLQLKYHFLQSGQIRLCHKKIINIILIINILQNQNQQCNKKFFFLFLSLAWQEKENGEGAGLGDKRGEKHPKLREEREHRGRRGGSQGDKM